MTKIWATNSNNDIYTENGRLVLKQDLQAVAQWSEHVVKAQLGEMPYAQDLGTNMRDSVFVGVPNIYSFESSARAQIRRIPEVIQAPYFAAKIENGILLYSMAINTSFGPEVVNGQL